MVFATVGTSLLSSSPRANPISSTATGVVLPLPALGMNAGGGAGALSLSWPAWANDWQLYCATNLTPPVSWILVTNVATSSNNGAFWVTMTNNLPGCYFRLGAP